MAQSRGAAEAGRTFGASPPRRSPLQNSPVMDLAHEGDSGSLSPGPSSTQPRGRSMKEYEEVLTALRKENFNLKLRLYFVEERRGGGAGTSGESMRLQPKSLAAELAAARREAEEKQRLLVEAARAVELLEEQHREERDRLRRQHADAEERARRCQRDLDKLKAQAEAAKDEAVRTAKDIEGIRKDLAKMEVTRQREKEEAFQRVKEAEEREKELQVQLQELLLKEQMRAAEGYSSPREVGMGSAHLKEVRSRSQLQEAVSHTQQQLLNLEAELELMRRQLQVQTQVREELEGTLAEQRKHATQLGAVHQKALQTIQAMTRMCRERDRKMKELSDEVEVLRAQAVKGPAATLALSRLECERIEAELELKGGCLMEQTAERDSLSKRMENKLQALSERLQEKEVSLEEGRAQLAEAEKRIEELEEELRRLREVMAAEASARKLAASVQEINNELTSKKEENNNNSIKDQEIERLNAELRRRTSNLQELVNKELWDKNRQIERLQARLARAEASALAAPGQTGAGGAAVSGSGVSCEERLLRRQLAESVRERACLARQLEALRAQLRSSGGGDEDQGDGGDKNGGDKILARTEAGRRDALAVCVALARRLDELTRCALALLRPPTEAGSKAVLSPSRERALGRAMRAGGRLARALASAALDALEAPAWTGREEPLSALLASDGGQPLLELCAPPAPSPPRASPHDRQCTSESTSPARTLPADLFTIKPAPVYSPLRRTASAGDTRCRCPSEACSEWSEWSEPDRAVSLARVGLTSPTSAAHAAPQAESSDEEPWLRSSAGQVSQASRHLAFEDELTGEEGGGEMSRAAATRALRGRVHSLETCLRERDNELRERDNELLEAQCALLQMRNEYATRCLCAGRALAELRARVGTLQQGPPSPGSARLCASEPATPTSSRVPLLSGDDAYQLLEEDALAENTPLPHPCPAHRHLGHCASASEPAALATVARPSLERARREGERARREASRREEERTAVSAQRRKEEELRDELRQRIKSFRLQPLQSLHARVPPDLTANIAADADDNGTATPNSESDGQKVVGGSMSSGLDTVSLDEPSLPGSPCIHQGDPPNTGHWCLYNREEEHDGRGTFTLQQNSSSGMNKKDSRCGWNSESGPPDKEGGGGGAGSPDLGIESDAGRFSSLEAAPSTCSSGSEAGRKTESVNDCIQKENEVLRRNLERTKKLLEATITQLTASNEMKREMERVICQQVHRTKDVVHTVTKECPWKKQQQQVERSVPPGAF